MEGDSVVAVFEKYFYDAASPRIHPPEEADAWFRRELDRSQVDGVVFYTPQEDDVEGWDYPRHLTFLQSRGVPSLLLRETTAPEPRARLIARVEAFVESLRRG
jgi:benzoyl-CoA reductase/2-hydroxyglutaryl-CoA dehydratase subunit BcrC/BadD/HgdB